VVDGVCYADGQTVGPCAVCDARYSTDSLNRLSGTLTRPSQYNTIDDGTLALDE